MNILFIFLTTISLFTNTMASSFAEGLIFGYISYDIQDKLMTTDIIPEPDYYNFTRDTSLQTFPIDYNPQCISEKHLFIDNIDLTSSEKNVLTILIYLALISPTMCMCCCGNDDDRERLLGIYTGICIHNIFSNNI